MHEALVRALEAHGIAGVTVLTGIAGYGAHRGIHRKGLIGLPHDNPNALIVIDNEAKLRAVLPTIRPMIAEGRRRADGRRDDRASVNREAL